MSDEIKETKPEEVTPDPQTPPVPPESSVEDTDPDGVPYKNRYAESERKREQLAETVESMTLRMNQLEQKFQPPPNVPSPSTPTPSKNDMDEMIRVGPEAFNKKIAEQVQIDFQHKQELANAESLIKEEYGDGRLQFGVAKVLDYAAKNMIDVKTHPTRAIKKILSEMKKPKTQPSAEDRKKTAEALKNKPEGGKRPPAPPVDRSSDLMENVKNRGSIDDVAAAIQAQWDQEGKK